MFRDVPPRPDYVALEREVLDLWAQTGAFELLRTQTRGGPRWSFLDGPITANNPMGVHHAWGRTYKDLYNRYHAMLGHELRWQQGFDCQGLWVEVEVEKELGFTTKRQIEAFGVAAFVNRCKERVHRFAAVQTAQSQRLGYWMDWDNSYYTLSDENNYSIWSFLKLCHERGWLYRGHDVMPWCPRCGTALSEHEIATEGYAETTHLALTVAFPLLDRPGEALLAWTTTPWTLPANVAAAVHPELVYVRVEMSEGRGTTTDPGLPPTPYWGQAGNRRDKGDRRLPLSEAKGPAPALERSEGTDNRGPATNEEQGTTTDDRPRPAPDYRRSTFWLLKSALPALEAQSTGWWLEVVEERAGVELVGWRYSGPFDDLLAQQGIEHRVVAWDEVSETEGTGVVHIAPGVGKEDFALGRRLGLPALAPLDDDGVFVAGYGWLTERRAGEVAEEIAAALERQGWLFAREPYTHRYPVCWRCGSELVFRLVDEWLIRMDELRQPMMEAARQAVWIPAFGLERELDWLRNMDDWMISKKRYWGLALPIYPCSGCGHVTVIGSKEELHERALAGWESFEGHSPHRPWVDAVTIGCTQCGAPVTRVPDVGNPWLDAGIVAFSTLNYRHDHDYWAQWFPADLVLESFPGQFRNWFYALLAMSTTLEGRAPFKTLLGYATVKDEHGEEMHKSKGNSIPFEQAAEWFGVEPLRWLYAAAPLERNLHLGQALVEELARRLQPLWEVYRFFVTYANLAGWAPASGFQGSATRKPVSQPAPGARPLLDQWLLARLDQLTAAARECLDSYDARRFTQEVERFLDDLSNWYVRRSRRRFWATGRSAGARRGAMQRDSTAPGNVPVEQHGDDVVVSSDDESCAAFATLYTTLVTLARLLAPVLPFLSEALYQNLVRSFDLEAPVSVHLTKYPGSDDRRRTPALERSEGTDERPETTDGTGAVHCAYRLRLLADMEVVRRVVALGRSGRRAAKLRLRLPLAQVLVVVGTPEEHVALERLRAEVLDELNIKDMEVLDNTTALVTYRVRPNLRLLGPKLGRSLAALRPVLDDLEPARAAEVAREITAGRAVMLTLEAGTLTLAPEELLVESMPLDGYTVAQEGGLQVALDTRLTESLRREGMARDLVRAVQEARKAAGLAPADRITLYLSGAPALKAVLDEWDAYVRGETLATALISSELPAGVYHEQVALEEGELVIGIGPAGESRGEGVKG